MARDITDSFDSSDESTRYADSDTAQELFVYEPRSEQKAVRKLKRQQMRIIVRLVRCNGRKVLVPVK